MTLSCVCRVYNDGSHDGTCVNEIDVGHDRSRSRHGLIDEIDLHIAPVLLGDGIRLFDRPGGDPVRLELLNGDDPKAAVNVRYHPVAAR